MTLQCRTTGNSARQSLISTTENWSNRRSAPVVEDNVRQPDLTRRHIETPYPAIVIGIPRQTKVVPLLYTLCTQRQWVARWFNHDKRTAICVTKWIFELLLLLAGWRAVSYIATLIARQRVCGPWLCASVHLSAARLSAVFDSVTTVRLSL